MMTVVLESALRTAITVGLVWVTLKLFRVTHVVSQKIAWSLVLIAALAMPSAMRWHAFRFSLPMALRSYPTIWPSTEAAAFPQVQTIEGATSNSVHPAIESPDTRSSAGLRMAKLNRFIAGIYLTICATLLLRLLLGLTWAFRVWRRARPVFGLSKTMMKVRSSRDISTPLTIGFCVVLPLPFEMRVCRTTPGVCWEVSSAPGWHTHDSTRGNQPPRRAHPKRYTFPLRIHGSEEACIRCGSFLRCSACLHFSLRRACRGWSGRSHSTCRTRNSPRNIHRIAGFRVIRSQHCQSSH